MKQFIIIFLFLIPSFKGFSQQPVFIDGTGLYSLNLNTCTSRFVGNANPGFYDIAFTPDGKLWGILSGLYQIDTTTGVTTFVGANKATTGVSLVALNDSVLLSEYNDTLWGINVRNAQSYYIGVIGYSACGDLSWYNGDLYMTAFNQLIKIILNDEHTAIISSTPVNNINNPIPCFLGLATVSFNGVDSLIGFAENDNTYRISPIDASYQLICSSFPAASGAASLPFGILPINLLSFSYTMVNKTVKLQWQTTTEINISYFLIERSSDGVNFSGIGKVNAAGNSNGLRQYAFVDNAPLSTNYYRLKEVDLDGKYMYSKIMHVQMAQPNALSIIGNPLQNILQLQINVLSSQTNYLSIFDFTGRKLKTFNVQNGLQNIDVSFLSSGTYVLQLITANEEIYNKTFSKIR